MQVQVKMPSLVQMIASRLFVNEPLPEPKLGSFQLVYGNGNKIQWNVDQKTTGLPKEDATEYVICMIFVLMS